eukprot:g2392.t1
MLVATVMGVALSALFLPFSASLGMRVSYTTGFLLFANWFVFWMPPIVIQGALYKLVLLDYLRPLYEKIDSSEFLRDFASKYVYRRPKYTDFFATQILFLGSAFTSLSLVGYWALRNDGYLEWWAVAAYNFAWIGLGGRSMGAAYSIAHKEGHFEIYRPWIKKTVGNLFENVFGIFYGSVPNNFTTTHISIHHRLDGGRGDTLYNWDISRSSVPSFMLYLTRGLMHTTGFGGLRQFSLSPRKRDAKFCLRKLATGCLVFWVVCPLVVVPVFGLSFYFWIVLQPLLCMTFFLSIINHGFHGFIEKDAKTGRMIDCVASTTMVGSLDDYFGEDDHMAHHHFVGVHYRDLPAHQYSQREIWMRHNASVFQGLDVFTFSVCVLMKAWPVLASRYLDFTNKMSAEEIERMLEVRATRRETIYSGILPNIQWNGDMSHVLKNDAEDESVITRYWPFFDSASRSLQLWICKQMEKGLPPIRPHEAFGFTEPAVEKVSS